MTTPVVVVRESATVENAILLMRAKRVRSLIVEPKTDGEAYGIVTEKDIVFKVIALKRNPESVSISTIMRQPCIQMPTTVTLSEAAQILADAGIHRAPVFEHGELLGIVSVTDILIKTQPKQPSQDELSQRIQEALQHARIIDDEEARMEQESDIAWRVFNEMQMSTHDTQSRY
jgi:signal-transduction protein with cAMP-binding, CBS, and nucleotidyltransferase domain